MVVTLLDSTDINICTGSMTGLVLTECNFHIEHWAVNQELARF